MSSSPKFCSSLDSGTVPNATSGNPIWAIAYGNCATCGEPIPLSRLQVQPAVPRCAGCQADWEMTQARSR